MRLNMNYTLLQENKKYNIPNYIKTKKTIISEETIYSLISEFNSAIRDSKESLSNSMNKEASDKVAIADSVNNLRDVITKVLEAVYGTRSSVTKIFSEVNANIISIYSQFNNDKIEQTYHLADRISAINKVMQNMGDIPTLLISSIVPSEKIMDKEYPDTKHFVDSIIELLDYITNIDKEGMESLITDIENKKQEIFNTLFTQSLPNYDKSNPRNSLKELDIISFGENKSSETPISLELYTNACKNIDNCKMVIDQLSEIEVAFNKEYSRVIGKLESVRDKITNIQIMNDGKSSLDSSYYDMANKVALNISRVLNAVQILVDINATILLDKFNRCDKIMSDSREIKTVFHNIIAESLGEKLDFVYNGSDQLKEFREIQDDFNSSIIMINEAFEELRFNDSIMAVLNEEEAAGSAPAGDGGNANADAAQTTVSSNNQQDNSGKVSKLKQAGGNVVEWLKSIIGKLGDTFKKFQNRIDEFIIQKDTKWWNDNVENIKKLQLSDTKVNEWHVFNLDSLKESTYLKFNMDAPELESDEKMQEAIIKKLTNNPPKFEEKDTFSEKIKKVYQGEYIKEDAGNEKTIAQVNYDHARAVAYVDGIINKRFNSDELGCVKDDYTHIDEDFKSVSKQFDRLLEEYKTKHSAAATETTQNAEPKTESVVDEDNFNLAEWFGLVHNEASFTVGENDKKNAGINNATSSGTDPVSKELDAKIKRCFNCNIIAVTAKMTAAMEAYKQYMGLFKSIYKSK